MTSARWILFAACIATATQLRPGGDPFWVIAFFACFTGLCAVPSRAVRK